MNKSENSRLELHRNDQALFLFLAIGLSPLAIWCTYHSYQTHGPAFLGVIWEKMISDTLLAYAQLDMCLAFGLLSFFLWRTAKAKGLTFWPWIPIIIVGGAIGVLVCLAWMSGKLSLGHQNRSNP